LRRYLINAFEQILENITVGRPPKNRYLPPGELVHDPAPDDKPDDQPSVAQEPSVQPPAPSFAQPPPDRRRRLSEEQWVSIIAQRDVKSIQTLASEFGITPGALYARFRKEDGPETVQHRQPRTSAPTMQQGLPIQTPQSDLRGRIVQWAVQELLGRKSSDEEREELAEAVRQELIRKVAEGI